MSTSDIYLLNKVSTTHFAEFQNGWGSAPVCWDYLGTKYIEEEPTYSMDMAYMKKVWALASDKGVPIEDRVCLMMTFDNAYVPVKALKDAAEACHLFAEKIKPDVVNHWRAFGDSLLEVGELRLSRHVRGVALSCTSVNDVWQNRGKNDFDNVWSIFD